MEAMENVAEVIGFQIPEMDSDFMSQFMENMTTTQKDGMQAVSYTHLEGKEFVARFYTLSLCSLVLHWMKNGMKESPEDLIEKLSLTVQGNIRSAMERFAK